MNIKQLKKQFTELTGLPAKKKSILWAIRQNKGSYSHWLSYARSKYLSDQNFTDTRTRDCWLSLVEYLEFLQSFGGNK